MESLYLDTHILLWLTQGNLKIFSRKALENIENCDLYYSSFVELELNYLLEKDKIKVHPDRIIRHLNRSVSLKRRDDAIKNVISVANSMSWTRDPFDRLISAQSFYSDIPLLTKDHVIQDNYSLAIW